jgi:stage V sporulation protein G
MEITEVKVFPVSEDKLKAYITIVLDDCFVVRDLKIIQGDSALFVAMPSKKTKEGQFKDIVHPVNQETRKKMEDVILEAYAKAISQRETAKKTEARSSPV